MTLKNKTKPLFPETPLHSALKNKLSSIEHEQIAKELNYKLDKFEKKLNSILSDHFLGLNGGNYDFKYTAEEFILALAKSLDISSEVVDDSFAQIKNHLSKCNHSPAHLLVVTDFSFEKNTMPIFILSALEGSRRKTFGCDEFIDDSEKMLSTVSDLVKSHYEDTSGKLFVWGDIDYYLYTSADSEKYKFLPDGTYSKITNDADLPRESRARVWIK